jgi:hypothetical protein
MLGLKVYSKFSCFVAEESRSQRLVKIQS